MQVCWLEVALIKANGEQFFKITFIFEQKDTRCGPGKKMQTWRSAFLMSPFTSKCDDVMGTKMVKYVLHRLPTSDKFSNFPTSNKTNTTKQYYLLYNVLHNNTQGLC